MVVTEEAPTPTGRYTQQLMLPYQLEFLQSTSSLLILTAGRGVGKSVALGFKAVILLAQGKDLIAGAPTFAMLKFTLLLAIEEALVACCIPYKYNKSDKTIKALGHTIYGLSGEAYEKGRGLTNISAMLIDEAAMLSKGAIEVWTACLRGKNVGKPEIIMASTPRPKTTKAKWFWEYNQRPEAHVIRAKTADNYLVSPEFVKSLELLYGDTPFYDQEVLGLFVEMVAGMLKSSWIKNNIIKKEKYMPTRDIVRAYDLAVSVKVHADYTATALVSKDRRLEEAKQRYAIHHLARWRKEWPETRKEIIRNAYNDGKHVPILIESFGTQISLVQDLRREPLLEGFNIRGIIPPGDKITKAMPMAAKMSLGLVDVVEGEVDPALYEEMDQFDGSGSTHDDMIDSLSLTYFGLERNIPAAGVKVKGLY